MAYRREDDEHPLYENLYFAEWNGIFLTGDGAIPEPDWPPLDVLVRLQKVIKRDGKLVLWRYQAFDNHAHPGSYEEQLAAHEFLLEQFARHTPNTAWIVEHDWEARITFYQATPDAPDQDETEWKPSPMVSWLRKRVEESDKLSSDADILDVPCDLCAQVAWSPRFEKPLYRGLRFRTCEHCGQEIKESMRLIRYRIGPPEPFIAPSIPSPR